MPMSLEEFQAQYGALVRATPEPAPARKYGWADRLGASVDSAQAGLLGVGEAAGLNWTEARRRNESAGDFVRAASIRDTGAPERISDINGPTSLVKGIAGLAIDSAPQLATSIAAGLATGGVGLGLNVAGRLGVAAAAGAPFNTGDILRNQREEAGRTDLPSALALTIPYTAADMVGLDGMLATSRMARNGARGLDNIQGAKGYLARTGATALTTGGKEGLSETGQELVNQAGRIAVNPNQTFFNPEANERYVESFAGGALLGGAFGAIGGGRRSQGFAPAQPGASEDLLVPRPDFDLDGYGAADGPLEATAAPQRGMYNPLAAAPESGVQASGPGQYDLYNPDGTPTYGADASFSDTNPLEKGFVPGYTTSAGAAPGLQQQGLEFTRDIPTGGMTLRAPIDTGTGDMFSGETRVPQAQPQAPFELQPPGNMQDGNQRELDLQPPMPGPQAPQVPRGNQKGITQQMPFSANTRSPQGQVLQGFVDSLAEEGYLDEGSYVQVATMVAQGKFAMAQKAVNEAVKNKAAAEKMIEQAVKIAEKQIAAEESANATAAPETPPASATGPAGAGRNRRARGNGAVAGAVQPAAPAAAAVQPGQQSSPVVSAGAQPVPALATAPAAKPDAPAAKAKPEAGLVELRKRQSVLNSIRKCLAGA